MKALILIRPRGMLGLVFGTGYSPRPESWLPYVFTSPEEAAEAGICELSSDRTTRLSSNGRGFVL